MPSLKIANGNIWLVLPVYSPMPIPPHFLGHHSLICMLLLGVVLQGGLVSALYRIEFTLFFF